MPQQSTNKSNPQAQSLPPTPTITRTHKRTANCDHIRRVLARTGLSPAELGKQWHLSANAVRHWLTANSAPAYTLLLAELSERRLSNSNTQQILATIPNAHASAIKAVLDSFGAKVTSIGQ